MNKRAAAGEVPRWAAVAGNRSKKSRWRSGKEIPGRAAGYSVRRQKAAYSWGSGREHRWTGKLGIGFVGHEYSVHWLRKGLKIVRKGSGVAEDHESADSRPAQLSGLGRSTVLTRGSGSLCMPL
jgi:hypothetical protein